MKIKKPLALGLVSGIALTTFAVAAPAFADPVANSYSIVGSDTLQAAVDALTNGTDATGARVRVVTASGSTLGNFDAFSPGYNAAGGTIQTKPATLPFGRPSGSGAGVDALVASIGGTSYTANGVTNSDMTGLVDIARSSAAPTTQKPTGILAWVPFGRDAVAYAYKAGSAADEANVASLTPAQLNAIYTANSDQAINGTTVKAYIPQSGSGTRKFFLSAIGITNNTVGTAVYSNSNTLAENDATVFPATVPSGTAYIAPFSAAAWIAQSNGVAPSTIPAGGVVKLGSPVKDGSSNPIPAVTGTGTLTPNSTYYSNTTFGRDTYLVVEAARIIDSTNPKYDASLAKLLDPTRSTSLVNMSTSASSAGGVKRVFGFLVPNDLTILRSDTK